ncbi:hypothetical protein ACQ86N_35825 [Puia sp. P3]|uniref:hypothetical protein n=1 Tax=Puia sp. P3 TaxID=3423952 RepID=UPI003D66CFC8
MDISIGAVVMSKDVRDSAEGYIYKQAPNQMGDGGLPNRIKQGMAIDIWIGAQRPSRDSTALQSSPSAY